MRIPTSQIYNRGLHSVLEAQRKLLHVENQIASETRILTPADDPVGKAQTLGLDDKISQNEQFQRNANLLKNRLQRTDSIYGSITTGLDRARMLMVQSGNGIFDDQDHRALAAELSGIRDEMLSLMNSQDENGDYLFSGFQKRTEPFSKDPVTGNYNYNGDDGRNQIQLSPALRVTSVEPGSAAFQNIPANKTLKFADSNGGVSGIDARVTDRAAFDAFHASQYNITLAPELNELRFELDATGTQITVTPAGITLPYTQGEPLNFNGIEVNFRGDFGPGEHVDVRLSEPTQNVVTTLDQFIQALEKGNMSSDMFEEHLTNALENMDRAQERLSSTRAQTGGRLNVLENAFKNNLDLEISNRGTRSKISDVDYSEAMTEFTKQDVSLQAAQAVFTRITRLSLFDFIR